MKHIIRAALKFILPYGIMRPLVDRADERRLQGLQVPSSIEPAIYSKEGKQKKTVYLQDSICRHHPYSFVLGREPKYINWDRFNYGLKNHVYTHGDMLKRKGSPEKSFAMLIESEAVAPGDYDLLLNNTTLAKEFNLVFTHSSRLLDRIPNSKLIPGGGVWYGTLNGGGVLSQENYLRKTKNISFVVSDSKSYEMHRFRYQLACKLMHNTDVNIMGTFRGGSYVPISASLDDYRYSVVIENAISEYWFTEKILNCFAAMTIPIYCGATKIAKYFNSDGIIELGLKDFDGFEQRIGGFTSQDYESRYPAVLDNYKRVMEYLCIDDYIYEKYGDLFA